MKTLHILRHAKSDWSDPSLDDFDRPLAPRGIKAARLMGKTMKRKGLVPALVLCSAARRTIETWELLGPELDSDVPLKVQISLYMASPSRLRSAIRRVAEPTPSLMILGHNPGLEQLAVRLSGPASKQKALTRLAQKFPTAALATFEFDGDRWSDVAGDGGRLVRFWRPKDLG